MWFPLVALGIVLVLLALYAWWTARRLDRLHARVDAAAAAFEAQLVRRATALDDFLDSVRLSAELTEPMRHSAATARSSTGVGSARELAEMGVTRAIARVVVAAPQAFAEPSAAAIELHDEALRATFARSFYNDTVRDLLVIRDRRVVRWLRLAGRAPRPSFFEMDDVELPLARISVASGPNIEL